EDAHPIADRVARAEPKIDSDTPLAARKPPPVVRQEGAPLARREGKPPPAAPSQTAKVLPAGEERERPADKGQPMESAAGGATVGTGTARAPATPDKDPDFQRAKNQIRAEAIKHKEHNPVGTARKRREEAERASFMPPEKQQEQSAKEKTT